MDVAGVATTEVLQGAGMPAASPVTARRMPIDAVYRWSSLLVALIMVVVLVAIVAVMLETAWPAFGRLGFGFFTGTAWNSATDSYGTLTFLVGTVITTGIALLVAVPISIAIALLLTEFAPRRVATIVGTVVDVAAGVPTIVFGVWAVLALVPWLRDSAEPAIQAVLGWIPLFSTPSIGYITGEAMFTAGIVLAAMIFPTIVAITRNSLLAAPQELREASLGLGATRWETATRVVLRNARSGLLGATILALGRALGEAIAIAYVIGSAVKLPESLFDVGDTLSTRLLDEAGGTIPGTLHTAALYELGMVLLVLSLLSSFAGRLLTQRLVGTAGLPGGGR